MKKDFDLVEMFNGLWAEAGFKVRIVNAPEARSKRARVSSVKRKGKFPLTKVTKVKKLKKSVA